MLISKQQIKCHVASKDDSRKQICGICFTQDGAVSTNGRCLLVIPYPEINADDFFEVPEAEIDRKFKLKEGEEIIITQEDAKHLEKNFFKAGELPIIPLGALGKIDNEKAQVAMSNISLNKVFTFKPVDGNYPDYKRVLPRSEPKYTIDFNITSFAEMLKIVAEALGDKDSKIVRFEFRGSASPVVVKGARGLLGLAMPARPDDEEK